MDRISDEQLDTLIDFLAEDIKTEKRPVFFVTHSALVELRERRAKDKVLQKSVQEQWCGNEGAIPDFAQRQVDSWGK
jgi:hypothetical protein